MYSKLSILSLLFFSWSALSKGVDVGAARIMLKDYGLATCVLSQFEESSAMQADIGRAVGAYSITGKGAHLVMQNEDTLEVLHDPYVATRAYMLRAYKNAPLVSKYTNDKIVFNSCLDIYNSKGFDNFIKSQDPYLPQ